MKHDYSQTGKEVYGIDAELIGCGLIGEDMESPPHGFELHIWAGKDYSLFLSVEAASNLRKALNDMASKWPDLFYQE